MPSDDPLDEHTVPPPDAEAVREAIAESHPCDPPALEPGTEWTCPECGQVWTADRDGVWRGSE